MRNLLHRMIPASEPFYPYPIENSVRFDRTQEGYISTDADVLGATDAKVSTMNAWVKRGMLAQSNQGIYSTLYATTHYAFISFDGSDHLEFSAYNGGTRMCHMYTAATFRDTSQWYNVHLRINTAEAAQADRIQIWVNGVRQEMVVDTYPTLNTLTCGLMHTEWYQVVGAFNDAYHWYDGYIANIHGFDGSNPPASEFGEFKYGTWIPKEFTNVATYSYGNKGFLLEFKNSADLRENSVPDVPEFTTTYGTPAQTEDTPTNNFPLWDNTVFSGNTVSEAGLRVDTSMSGFKAQPITIAIPKTGKWQIEFRQRFTNGRGFIGVINQHHEVSTTSVTDSNSWGYFGYNGSKYAEGVETTGYGDTFSANDQIVGMTFDADTGELEYFLDGVSQGVAFTLPTDDTYFFYGADGSSSHQAIWQLNNGAEGGFDYPVTGAKAICTKNWPQSEVPVIDGELGLWVPTWTGLSDTDRDFTGSPFEIAGNDVLIWMKDRDAAFSHNWYDTVRGANLRLESDTTDADQASPAAGYLDAFLTNGWSTVEGSTDNSNWDLPGDDYVAWVFNMLSKYGMEILTHTGNGVSGREISHNLGVAPELIISKSRNATSAWLIGHAEMAPTGPWYDYITFDGISKVNDDAAAWNLTAPTALVFTVGSGGGVNAVGNNYVVYLFASVPGFSNLGYWIGNASTNGPRIYTGFRPRLLLVKNVNAVNDWVVLDSMRNPYNLVDNYLLPSTSGAESSTAALSVDFLSNGFKVRSTGVALNGNGNRMIYLAIADMPFPYCNAF